ncbi:hypothetical protein ACFV29_39750 [Streptomyces sp. NPDC059690]|uniref:hypothetical protein n=1 Tax=Streptomyces sp. NPDC059690 TaxID=3346907 RepID=UPI0036808508
MEITLSGISESYEPARPRRPLGLSVGDLRDRQDRQRDGTSQAAAGDKDVQVRGAYTAQRALEAEVLDEVQIHQIPVPLGDGGRLFDVLASQIELEIIRVIDTPEATHIRYRVRR